MKLLALETSTNACSVALLDGETLIERHEVQAKGHTALLIPMLRDVLLEGRTAARDLDAIVLGNGPGSFIGMRIAASVAQGMAYGAGLGIVPVSSLAAVAAQVFQTSDARQVVVAQDAHMNEVYLACFSKGPDGLPVADGETALHPVTRRITESAFSGVGIYAAGAGWRRHPQLLEVNDGGMAELADVDFPRAAFLLGLGAKGLRAGTIVQPAELVPDYVRSKVASVPGSL